MTQIVDPHHFDQKARQIKVRTSKVLTKWGLIPRFKRWRLTQDTDTGMIVLFGILNDKYIAAHTSIPFGDYFDQRLLHDLANELQIQIVSCNSDSLRYAFVLDRGSLGKLPTHIDFPFLDEDKPSVRVVYGDESPPEILQSKITPAPIIASAVVDDRELVHQGVGAFLKVFDDIKDRDDAAQSSVHSLPNNIVVVDEGEFYKRVAEHKVNRQRRKRIRKLFENTVG